MKEIKAAAGQRVRVVRRAFSSVPIDYRFQAKAAKPGETLAGTIEVRKSRWMIPGTPAPFPLHANNLVQAGFWNTFMTVDVVPAVDTVITVEGRSIRHLTLLLVLSLLIVIVAAAMLAMFGT